MKSSIVRYKNGNYNVIIDLCNGTKIRENNLSFFEADFPESMDIKITNRCDMGCPMCHEDSTICGDHGDIMSESFIDRLHPYTELALGGGNVLEHPDFVPFLEKCKSLNLICNTTINQKHFMENVDLIKDLCDRKLIYGLGVSLTDPTDDFIEIIKQFPNAVIHVINGLISIDSLKKLAYNNLKILILGYKQFRRGEVLFRAIPKEIIERQNATFAALAEIIEDNWFDVVSFDNLALNQLEPKRIMTEEEWNAVYMGDDGINGNMTSASMYADMVKREFGKNSCAVNRYPLMDTAKEMFNFLKLN